MLIYDRTLKIFAKKGKSSLFPRQKFVHTFSKKHKARIYGNPDGSITIKSSSGKKLWNTFNY